ncbi:MAG: 2-amino-4-hydroxy-6-hydroxymethyldihydropteridine diphosphokinase [Acetobacteraceae bacterium]
MAEFCFIPILVAIGANLPGPDGRSAIDTCRCAAARMDAWPGFRLIGLSRWFETEPIPPSGQPPYVNGVALLQGTPDVIADPAAILGVLLSIETGLGRVRSVPNAARSVDLDLIAIGDTVRQSPDPILPHPRAHLRAFVLAPLADVAPGWVHPVLNRRASEMLAGLPRQGFRPL